MHGRAMASTQPAKLAAAEAQWETQKGAPFSMLLIPDEANERNLIEALQIPKLLSFLSYKDWNAEVKGLKEWPVFERPPVTAVFWSFRLMVGLGFLFVILTVIGFIRRNKLESSPVYLRTMLYAIPLPYIAAQLGWTVTELGRQPWIVYGVMKTSDAVSPIAVSQVGISLIGFIVVYSLLGLIAAILMVRHAKKGYVTSESDSPAQGPLGAVAAGESGSM